MSPTISSLLFHTAWRHLSFQATPWMIPRSSLDENGLIPRALFPEVYDQVVSSPSILPHPRLS